MLFGTPDTFAWKHFRSEAVSIVPSIVHQPPLQRHSKIKVRVAIFIMFLLIPKWRRPCSQCLLETVLENGVSSLNTLPSKQFELTSEQEETAELRWFFYYLESSGQTGHFKNKWLVVYMGHIDFLVGMSDQKWPISFLSFCAKLCKTQYIFERSFEFTI